MEDVPAPGRPARPWVPFLIQHGFWDWRRNSAFAYVAVLVGVVGHVTSEFVSVLNEVGGPEVSVWRFTIGGAGLVRTAPLFTDSRNLIAPLVHDSRRIVAIAVLGVSVPYLAFHCSLDYASVPQVATLVTAIPVFVAIIAPVVDRSRVAGVKITTGLLALICAAGAAAYIVMIRPVVAAWGGLRATALTMAVGGAVLWLGVGLCWGVWANPRMLGGMPTDTLAEILVLELFNTTLTQFLWIGGLAAVPDLARGAALFFLKPVIASALAAVFLANPCHGSRSRRRL